MSEELSQITAKISGREKELADIKASSTSLKTVDTAPLLRKLEELKEQMDQVESERNAAIANNQRKNETDTQIGYLVDGIKDIKSHADHVKGKLEELKQEGQFKTRELLKLEVPDMEPLQAQLCDLQTSQAFQRDLDRVSDMTTELKTVKKSADELDRAVKTLQTAAPAEMLAAAAMPVNGLAYSAGQFTLNGVPIQNLSTSQKVTLAVAVTRNLNKGYEIKAICLDGFESLDVDTQKAFMEEAAKDDFQYFVTQVANFDDKGQPLEKLVIESK
jgi:DNA repair exonuclease SbcCD ATPase subunit